jgi:phosphoribosylanthranilate isomerase
VAVDAKICGLTRPEDTALAVALGAARLGVVFAGGPRQLSVSQAQRIVAAAGAVPVIGVFGDQPMVEILTTVREAGLRGVQLHLGGSATAAAQAKAAGLEVWRVAQLPIGADPAPLIAAVREGADAVLIEPRHPDGRGGHGVALPRAQAIAARAALPGTRLVLAGGLTPESVGAAIAVVSPDIVDVSSGVEAAPGIKDPDRLARFLEIVRDARPAA